MKKLEADLENILEKNHFNVNSYILKTIATHLLIIISRMENHYYLDCSDRLSGKNVSVMAKEITTYLKEEYDVDIPSVEMSYLSMILSSKTYPIDRTFDDASLSMYIEDAYISISEEIVHKLQEYYSIEFSQESYVRFAFHIQALARRSKMNKYVENPHTGITRATNPFLFEIGVFISDILKEHAIYINDDEIAFLAFHIGAFYEVRRSRHLYQCWYHCRNI